MYAGDIKFGSYKFTNIVQKMLAEVRGDDAGEELRPCHVVHVTNQQVVHHAIAQRTTSAINSLFIDIRINQLD